MRLKIICKPLGNKISITVEGKIFCTKLNNELRSSFCLTPDDLICQRIFGSTNKAKRFASTSKTRVFFVEHYDLGYSSCDVRA